MTGAVAIQVNILNLTIYPDIGVGGFTPNAAHLVDDAFDRHHSFALSKIVVYYLGHTETFKCLTVIRWMAVLVR